MDATNNDQRSIYSFSHSLIFSFNYFHFPFLHDPAIYDQRIDIRSGWQLLTADPDLACFAGKLIDLQHLLFFPGIVKDDGSL